MNTTRDDETLGTGEAAQSERGDPPDRREIRGEDQLQGMREDGDRYEQMREPDGELAGAAVPGDQGGPPAPLGGGAATAAARQRQRR